MNTTEYATVVLEAQPPYVADAQPAIVERPAMRVERDSLAFLRDRYITSGARPSPHTWRACADALAGWMTFCSVQGVEFLHADSRDLITYRDAYLNAISPQGRRYDPKTVATRIGYIQEFYDYLTENGRYGGDIGAESVPKRIRSLDRTPNAHLRTGNPNDGTQSVGQKIKPKATKHEPIRPLGPQEVKALVDAADRSKAPQRNRILLHLGWVCGLRREEVQRLTVNQFQSITTDPDTPVVQHEVIIVGKRNVSRKVPVPAWLVDEVNAYIANEREQAVKRGRKKPSQLILGASGSRSGGQPITLSGIDHLMKTLCTEAGLIELVERQDPETGAVYTRSRPAHSFHDLRHTYAVLTYHLEKRNGNAEPWKKIQAVLGHKNASVTMDTYLEHVNAFDAGPPVDYRGIL